MSLLIFTALRFAVWHGVELSQMFGFVAIGLGVAVSAASLIWLGLGLWRASERAIRDSGFALACLGYAALLVAAVTTVEQSARLFTGSTQATVLEQISPVSLPVENGVVTLTGLVDFEMYSALKATLAQDNVQQIALRSDGGLINAARGLARLIEDAKLATLAIGPCRSACTLVFMAGHPRHVTGEAQLGFHSYALQDRDKVAKIVLGNPNEELERDLAWMQSRGIGADFTAKIAATPHSEMWHPSVSELRAAGVLVD